MIHYITTPSVSRLASYRQRRPWEDGIPDAVTSYFLGSLQLLYPVQVAYLSEIVYFVATDGVQMLSEMKETLCNRFALGVLPGWTVSDCCRLSLLCSTTDSIASRAGWNLLLARLATCMENSAVRHSRESSGLMTTFRHRKTRRSFWTCSLAFESPARITSGFTIAVNMQPSHVNRNQSDPICSTNIIDIFRFPDVNGNHAIIDRISNTVVVTSAFFSAHRA